LAANQDRILGHPSSGGHQVGPDIDPNDIDTAWLQSSDSQLSYVSEGGNILGMGRDPTRNQTPDLFSTGRLDGSPSNSPPEAPPGRPFRRAALPKDLPRAIQYLEDRELDWLLQVAAEEAKRRGRPMPIAEVSPTNTPAASSELIPKETKPLGRPTHQRQIRPAAASLSRGQVNAVWAAFKAGVTPSRIARQFGLSQSDVRKALSSDEPRR
jgi:hypothetical protein